MEIFKKTINKIINFFNYYILYNANKISYLRSKGMKIGDNCDLLNDISDYGSEPYLIKLCSNITITHGVVFITHDASTRLFRSQFPEMNEKYGNKFGTITILDNCFIGINSIILPGLTIGPNSIVGAGSVVTKNIPPNSVFAGNPAKYICSLEEYIQKIMRDLLPLSSLNRKNLEKELVNKLWKD